MSLSLKNVDVNLGRVPVLRSFELEVTGNSVQTIIGINGSGKTTVLNCVSGIVPLEAGTISINETNIVTMPSYLRARRYIRRNFQGGNVFAELSVLENLNASIELSSYQLHNVDDHCEKLLLQFQLDEVAGNAASEVSFGQRKLLSLAMAMAVPSEVLLLDEPVAGLQPSYLEIVADAVIAYEGVRLVVDHNLDFLRMLGGTSHFLSGGQIIESGALEDVLSIQSVRDQFL